MLRRQNKNQNQQDDDNAVDYVEQNVSTSNRTSFYMTSSEIADMVRIFLPKIVLEIFGSVGACWGFFEAVGLRNASTAWFWRPACIAVGGVYLIRYFLQVIDHYNVLVERRVESTPQLVPPTIMHSTKEAGIEGGITKTEDANENV